MELVLLFGVLLSSILTISLIHYLSILKTSNNLRLPPGKTGWPVIGESIEFLTHLKKGHSEEFFFKRMTRYCPDVFKTSIVGDDVAVLCGAAGNKFMFSNTNKLVKRWLVRPAKMLLFPDEVAVATDRCLKPAFLAFMKADGLRNFIEVMDTMAQHHLESHWHGQAIKVYPLVNRYAFELACRFFLSIEDEEAVEKLFQPMERIALGIQSLPIDLPGSRMHRGLKARDELRLLIHELVRLQRSTMESSSNSSPQNLLSYLLQACHSEDDDRLVVDGIIALLYGGHGTLTSVLCMIFKVMADRPHIYRRVYQENMEVAAKKKDGEVLSMEDTHNLRYTWNVAREVMRLYPPAPIITREALTDFTYAGYHIPKGYKLITSIYATHKDPKYFPEPEKFDPSRFDGDGPLPYTYIPFGGGSVGCSGKNYSQLVIQVFIHNAVKRFKWEALIPDEKIVGIPLPKPAQGLPILLHPHQH